LTIENQNNYDAALLRFQNLRADFKTLHRLKHVEYINKVECELKSNPCEFFKLVNLKRKSCGYPSSMFFENTCAQNPQEITNLFSNFYQSVYVEDDNISAENSIEEPTFDDADD
jgi:hypothetical protein